MKSSKHYIKIILPLLFFAMTAHAAFAQSERQVWVVDALGKGNVTTIQQALDMLPDSSETPRIILIKNGVYNEKIYITKHNVILRGEDRNKTIITQSIARDEWRCSNPTDWGVATMNVSASDITLENLSVINDFGFNYSGDKTIACANDSSKPKKITKNSHQMALRTINATRLKAINCHFKAFGGDTVSPWDVEDGMFYFKDCVMEGGVDFYCPRGWAYAENCHFISHSGTAAIWHDGSVHKDSKTVLKNCTFSGFDGFNLGRYHKDAQFYLINCTFPANMANREIYHVPQNQLKWGKRIYFSNSHRTGGDYAWHKDNLHTAEGSPKAADINAQWVFKGNWNPEKLSSGQ